MKAALIFILVLFVMGCLESSRGAPEALANKYKDTVVLYSTTWCGYCRKTSELLSYQRIEFIELDIEASAVARKEFDELGGRGIPLVLAKGRVVEGYAPKAVMKLIKGT